MTGKTPPYVSVIIPVYNGENYLKEAIDSVFAQTYTNFELIVVDDGSTDRTWELIQSFKSRIRGIHKQNGGVASALNRGIFEAHGEWIAWLSHDDIYLPEKIEKQITFLSENSEVMACYTDYFIIGKDGQIISLEKSPWYSKELFIRRLFGVCFINGSSMIINKKCFDVVGYFSEEYRFTQDAHMWFRLAEKFTIGRINEPLIKWRWHPSQDSKKFLPHMLEEQKMYEQTFETLGHFIVFPELTNYKDRLIAKAKGYEWFGDILMKERNWSALALKQYSKSLNLFPGWKNPARLKSFLVRFQTIGNSQNRDSSEALLREGRFLAGRGFLKDGRNYFKEAWLKNPFALNCVIYWIAASLGKPMFKILRSVRKHTLEIRGH